MANKATLTIFGADDLIQRLNDAALDVDAILYDIMVDNLTQAGQDMISTYQAIPKNNPTNIGVKSYNESFNNNNGVISGQVGFDMRQPGGVRVFFREYGCPYIEPTFFIRKIRDELRQTLPDEQRQAIMQVLEGY